MGFEDRPDRAKFSAEFTRTSPRAGMQTDMLYRRLPARFRPHIFVSIAIIARITFSKCLIMGQACARAAGQILTQNMIHRVLRSPAVPLLRAPLHGARNDLSTVPALTRPPHTRIILSPFFQWTIQALNVDLKRGISFPCLRFAFHSLSSARSQFTDVRWRLTETCVY
jgi:hypothetical protein